MKTPNTEGQYWPAKLRNVICLLSVVALTGCCATTAVIPRTPAPAADLMIPAPTGSQVLQRATRNMETWLPTPQDGQTK